VTIVNLPPLEVVGSLAQTAGIKSKGVNALQNEDQRSTLNADAEKMKGDLQNLDRPYLNTQLGFPALSPYLPTPTIVNLPSFEESGWEPYRPDLIPASKEAPAIPTVTQTIHSKSVSHETMESKAQAPSPFDRTGSTVLRDAEISLLPLRMENLSHFEAEEYEAENSKFGAKDREQPVLVLKPTFQSLPISSKLSPQLDNSKIQTISPPDTAVDKNKERIYEIWEDKVLIELPLLPKDPFEIRLEPKRNLTDFANNHGSFPDILISTDGTDESRRVREALPETPSEWYQTLRMNRARLRIEESPNHPNRAGDEQELPNPSAWRLDMEPTQESAEIDTGITHGLSPVEAFSEKNFVVALPRDAHRGLPLTYGFERVRLPVRVQFFRENNSGNLQDVLVEHSAQSKTQTDSGSEGVVPSLDHRVGESDTGMPGPVLTAPAQISALGQSPYLDSAVLGTGSNMRDLLTNPIPSRTDGRISTNPLSPFVDPFGLKGKSHDFTVPFLEPLHYSEYLSEDSFLLGPKEGVGFSLIVGLPGARLGVFLCFSIGTGIAFRSRSRRLTNSLII
jgi:hypothetical protein